MKTALLVLLIVLAAIALLFLLLCCPLFVNISYVGQKTQVYLRYLFIKIRLYPQKKSKKKKKNKNEKKERTSDKSAVPKKSDDAFFDKAQKIVSLISSGGRVLGLVLSMHNAKFNLSIKVGGEDAAEIAIKCGRLSAFFHSAAAVISNAVNIRSREISIYPDYDSKKTVYTFYARLWFYPISLFMHIGDIIPEIDTILDALPEKK